MVVHPLPRIRRLVLATALGAASALIVLSAGPGAVAADGDDPAVLTEGTPTYGGVVRPRSGESYPAALTRLETAYGGRLGVIRYFDSNAPDPWSTLTPKFTDHNVI